jgi:hypothetical protein
VACRIRRARASVRRAAVRLLPSLARTSLARSLRSFDDARARTDTTAARATVDRAPWVLATTRSFVEAPIENISKISR